METVDALLTSFFARDDLDALTAQAGAMLGCPIFPAIALWTLRMPFFARPFCVGN